MDQKLKLYRKQYYMNNKDKIKNKTMEWYHKQKLDNELSEQLKLRLKQRRLEIMKENNIVIKPRGRPRKILLNNIL